MNFPVEEKQNATVPGWARTTNLQLTAERATDCARDPATKAALRVYNRFPRPQRLPSCPGRRRGHRKRAEEAAGGAGGRRTFGRRTPLGGRAARRPRPPRSRPWPRPAAGPTPGAGAGLAQAGGVSRARFCVAGRWRQRAADRWIMTPATGRPAAGAGPGEVAQPLAGAVRGA